MKQTVPDTPRKSNHIKQRNHETLSLIKLRHSDMSQDEGVNRLKDEMT